MDRQKVEKMIASAEKRASAAYYNYQETGNGRYYNAHTNNEELAEALRGYLNAKEKIYTANRLSSYIKQWASVISEMQYYSEEQKEQATTNILNEITAEALAAKYR